MLSRKSFEPEDEDGEVGERRKAAQQTDRYGLSRRESIPVDALSIHTLVARTARRHPDSKERLARIQSIAVSSLTDMLRRMFSLGSILRQSLTICSPNRARGRTRKRRFVRAAV